jgi:hypothetical protein
VAGLAANHLLRKHADSEGVRPRPRMVRVGKELASLSVSLSILCLVACCSRVSIAAVRQPMALALQSPIPERMQRLHVEQIAYTIAGVTAAEPLFVSVCAGG